MSILANNDRLPFVGLPTLDSRLCTPDSGLQTPIVVGSGSPVHLQRMAGDVGGPVPGPGAILAP